MLVIGNPFGIGQTVTSGIVSALGRQGIGNNHSSDLVQTRCLHQPRQLGRAAGGFWGRVLDINTALIGPGSGSVGIGFATPANRVRAAMDKIPQGRGKTVLRPCIPPDPDLPQTSATGHLGLARHPQQG